MAKRKKKRGRKCYKSCRTLASGKRRCYKSCRKKGGARRKCEKKWQVCELKSTGNLVARKGAKFGKKKCSKRGTVKAFTREEAKKDFRLKHGSSFLPF